MGFRGVRPCHALTAATARAKSCDVAKAVAPGLPLNKHNWTRYKYEFRAFGPLLAAAFACIGFKPTLLVRPGHGQSFSLIRSGMASDMIGQIPLGRVPSPKAEPGFLSRAGSGNFVSMSCCVYS